MRTQKTEVSRIVPEYGSFKDPAGHIFSLEGKIYRSVLPPGVEDFQAARKSGIFDKLIAAGFLIQYEEMKTLKEAPRGTVYCLKHPILPFISYPWEWSFSMLKDAALLHLDIMEKLLPEGFWLRDASAFNVQYDGSGLKLIDILSIGKRVQESPWVAYGQFCSHFLAPLVMAAYGDIRFMGLWRNFIDGYPLDLAVSILPLWKICHPGLFMHLILHARFQKNALRLNRLSRISSKKKPVASDAGLVGIIRSLRKTVASINFKKRSGLWLEYEKIRTYGSEDVKKKSAFLIKALQQIQPEMVWDLGANTGEFSRLAASQGAFVVSIEQDPTCTEHVYKTTRFQMLKERILPLTMDLANPSPGLGWNGQERINFKDRGPADLVLALALIHHLVLSSYIPMERIAQWLSEIAKNLIAEFIPPDDPMVLQLLSNRFTGHLVYNEASFREGFGMFFVLADEMQLSNGRIMTWYKRR